MRTHPYRLVFVALLLATTVALALASPLKVSPKGGESQTVIMCPDCSKPIACAKVGDYSVALSAELPHPKMGVVHFYIGLTDRAGRPVENAKVAVAVWMPEHKHKAQTVAKGGKNGRYMAVIGLEPNMVGQWQADVQITTPKGDVVTQAFTFTG